MRPLDGTLFLGNELTGVGALELPPAGDKGCANPLHRFLRSPQAQGSPRSSAKTILSVSDTLNAIMAHTL